MSIRHVVSVKVQDRKLRDLGPIQGALVTLQDKTSIRRELVTDSHGLAVFILPPGQYKVKILAAGYTTPIVDFIGDEHDTLEIDTMNAAQRYPMYANMTRDE